MRVPRIRFTIGRLMIVVAAAALISVVATNPYRRGGITDKRVVVPVASAVAAAYGLGAMRRPWVSLAPLVVTWIVTPVVDHPAPDVINTSAVGCDVAWLIGAPAGWISRGLASPGNSGTLPVGRNPPPTD